MTSTSTLARRLRALAGTLALGIGPACEDDPDADCSDGSCVCTDVSCACAAGSCDVECGATDCGTLCVPGGSCAVDCSDATACSVHCQADSSCEVDCADATVCSIQCDEGAECRCHGERCVMACTPLQALTTCASGGFACGPC